jgi:hypothetical protein
MGYGYYEIIRNGEKIEAGYGVKARCEKRWCWRRIDRGLAYLCGKTPGGDEHGCGDNHCKPCAEAADKANAWTHPDTGEEFDLRDQFLPAGSDYDARGIVWRHTGNWQDETPLVEPVYANTQAPAPGAAKKLTEGEWEEVGRIIHRQIQTA